LNSLNGLANCEINNVENLKYLFICESTQSKNKLAFLLDPSLKDSSESSKIKSAEFEAKEMIRNIIFDNRNRKFPFVFVVRKTQANNEYTVEALKFKKESSSFESLGAESYDLSYDDEIKLIKGDFGNEESKKRFSYVIVTKFHQIRTIHKNENVKIKSILRKYIY